MASLFFEINVNAITCFLGYTYSRFAFKSLQRDLILPAYHATLSIVKTTFRLANDDRSAPGHPYRSKSSSVAVRASSSPSGPGFNSLFEPF